MSEKIETIKITKNVFPEIRKILGLKNLKCCGCGKRITKNNFGWLSKDVVGCNNIFCLMEEMDKAEKVLELKKK